MSKSQRPAISPRPSRDFTRQRWPFGLHKIAVWRVAPTAAPRMHRVNLPMAVPFGLGSRRGICVYHRRCGTISFRQTRALWSTFGRGKMICAWRPGAPSLPLCFRHRQAIRPSGILKRLETRHRQESITRPKPDPKPSLTCSKEDGLRLYNRTPIYGGADAPKRDGTAVGADPWKTGHEDPESV